MLEFSTFNGRVTLIPTSGDDLTITITKLGRRTQIDNVDIIFAASLNPAGIETVSLLLTQISPAGSGADVHLEALVPTDISYNLDLSTRNGTIEVRQLHGLVLVADTGNGAIAFDDVEFDSIQAETSNGKVSGVLGAKEVKNRD